MQSLRVAINLLLHPVDTLTLVVALVIHAVEILSYGLFR